jgi:hypothetical protein
MKLKQNYSFDNIKLLKAEQQTNRKGTKIKNNE